jgi:hypothetical protein
MILQRARHDLGRRCGIAIDEHNYGIIVRIAVPGDIGLFL